MEDFLPMGLPIVPIVKAVGITSSFILAGSTATVSVFLPAILPTASRESSAALERQRARTMVLAWRVLHRTAFYASIPPCLVGSMAWTFCLLTTPPDALALRVLYGAGAVGVGGVLGYSVTIMGDCIRALYRLAAEAEDEGADLEKQATLGTVTAQGDTVDELVRRWGRHNLVRATLVGLGAACGTWAALNECFLGGVQVGAHWVIQQIAANQKRAAAVGA